MKTLVTKGIILLRTNFQEADRIITMLTPDRGKIRLIAKGVRRPKSKMAGGIELLSVSDITYLPGKGEIGTLISARLDTNYPEIVKDINKTMFAYEMLKQIDKITESEAEAEYFELLQKSLDGLNSEAGLGSVQLWFILQLLQLTGHSPELNQDVAGNKLVEKEKYVFSFDDMAFAVAPAGQADGQMIKLLRLGLTASSPQLLGKVQVSDKLLQEALRLATTMQKLYLL